MSRRLDYTVPPELSGRRIRSILQNQLGLSAGLVTRLRHRENAVLLNGRPARTLDPVRAGDRLSVEVGDEKKGAFAPGGPRLEVLWEDEDILIINKPADMAVHGRSEHGEPTVGSAVAAYLGTAAPFHPVNRLDRGTTGVMCAAKTGYMHERLRRLLHTPGLRREYLAISVGVPEPASGVIDLPMRLDTEDRPRQVVDWENGKKAVTEWRRLGVEMRGDRVLTRVAFHPLTGRTHQLRLHAAKALHPIVGDRLYGRQLPGERLCLHAESLTMKHPVTGEAMTFTAPVPF